MASIASLGDRRPARPDRTADAAPRCLAASWRKPVHGMTAAEIHEMAEAIRKQLTGAAK